MTPHHLRELQKMIERDPMHDHHEQEKEMIWQLRHECREHFPQSLPKLLTCVHWDNHVDVAIVSYCHCCLIASDKLNCFISFILISFSYRKKLESLPFQIQLG